MNNKGLKILLQCLVQYLGLNPINADIVVDLPGLYFTPNFRQFSGYLDGLDGVLLHYWMFESRTNPKTDPVVLWLNGGPGVSSLVAALMENGPFRINEDQEIELNDFSWNERATMIYLESPAGVGFSFKSDRNYTTNDDLVANNNLEALKSFFKKYPYFLDNDFYIAGEHYAGIFIPTLASICLENQFPKNFKGIAIGNGMFDDIITFNSIIHYYYHHGMINDNNWINLQDICCPKQKSLYNYVGALKYTSTQKSISDYRNCNYRLEIINNNELCKNFTKKLMDFTLRNPFNIYEDINYDMLSLIKQIKHQQYLGKKQFPIFSDYYSITSWLNDYYVRQELNIFENFTGTNWNHDNSDILNYKFLYPTVKPFFQRILNFGIKILIYHGDLDSISNYLAGRWFIEDLGLNATSDYLPWRYDNKLVGFQIQYGNLTYKTVMAAGSMISKDQPGPAQKLFHDFLDSN